VPTDLSENSRRGLLYACSLGAENKGDLTVLHVANEFNAWELYTDELVFWPARNELGRQIRTFEASLDLNHFWSAI
jgi:hypothetical protein